MSLSTRVLGKSTVAKEEALLTAPILRIGADRFMRHHLAAVDCFHFHAARTLDRVLNAELHVGSTKDLFDNIAPGDLALPQLGVIAFLVLGRAFEVKGLGGDRPLEAWVTRHRSKEARREYVTVATLKQQHKTDADAAKKERREKKRRKSARRDQAHRLRTERFNARQTGTAE